MNSVINLLKSHRSIRKYKDKEIPEEILSEILRAATYSSTSGNMQAYSIIVSKSVEMKERMLKAHFNQSMLLEAPVFLTFCADFNRMRRWIKLKGAANNFDNYMSFMIASIDAILASQNAVVAAESLDLGICYMGTTLASAKELGEILELPENVVPIVGFSLGYPDESPPMRKRLPLESIIHFEKYRSDDDQVVLDTYKDKEVEGMKRYRKVLGERDDIESLAHVYTQLKYTERSHIKYSDDLLNYLKSQGFL